jgi:hypothetical protein
MGMQQENDAETSVSHITPKIPLPLRPLHGPSPGARHPSPVALQADAPPGAPLLCLPQVLEVLLRQLVGVDSVLWDGGWQRG